MTTAIAGLVLFLGGTALWSSGVLAVRVVAVVMMVGAIPLAVLSWRLMTHLHALDRPTTPEQRRRGFIPGPRRDQ